MSDCENIINPLGLKREGTDQNQRVMPMLKPESAPIDAKTVADDLVCSQQLAQYLKYFGSNNEHFGKENWQIFFNSDVSVALALVAVQDINEYKTIINQKFKNIQKNTASPAELIMDFGSLFNLITSLAWQIESLQNSLPEDIILKNAIQNLIKNKLALPFQKLYAYFHAAKTNNLIDDTETINLNIFGEPINKVADNFNKSFGKLWAKDSVDWTTFKATFTTDGSIYNLTTTIASDIDKRLYFATTHNFFTAIFDQFLRAFSKIVADANTQLQQTLSERNDHQPHLALFISFLKLLNFARKDANLLTKRHLDLYYKEILQISERKPKPNQVHVVFEAAKFIESILIKKGTLLNAAKDSLGNDVAYQVDEDTVINKAKITSLSSVYIGTKKDDDLDNSKPLVFEDRLYASPVANSENGLGEELTSTEKQWHPFASKKYLNGVLQDIKMPKADIGFAIASHYLYLKEGQRKIIIEITATNNLPSPNDHWEAEVTTAEGWKVIPITVSFTSNILKFENNSISANFPAIMPYNRAIHGRNYEVNTPIIRLKLKHLDAKFQYKDFKNIVVEKVTITVGSTKVKDIFAQNPLGILDPSKPFLPFGPIPEKDTFFIIGSDEIFQKKGAIITTNIAWQNLPTTFFANPPAKIQKLQLGNWNDAGSEANLLDGISTVVTIGDNDLSNPNFDGNKIYDVNSKNGFFRFKLNGSFGHLAYQMALTSHLIDKAKGNSDRNDINSWIRAYKLAAPVPTAETTIDEIKKIVDDFELAPPILPYTPTIEEIWLSYTASTEVFLNDSNSYENRTLQFFHCYPFGEIEQHRKLKDALIEYETEVKLLPYFKHFNNGDTFFEIEGQTGFVEHEGEFYISLSEVNVGQKVAILFQLDEGSANPKIKKPENHVHWSYLSNNCWTSFQKLEVEDRTSQLTRSGIITFTIPKLATSNNTLLAQNQLWLRASVHEASEAICKIIAVLPHTVLATFKDQSNAADFLATALPAGTIAKLFEPEASIKKLEQPYNSFGGRTQENSSDYYKRVSERLRHKDRAITVWDYEHLILEEFTNIYKVKVINHTRYEPSDSGVGIYNELAAGHVTIVPIPNLQNRNAIDPLKPYTNVADLEAITTFIGRRKSCFAKIHVHNPIFEEIKVECKVMFFQQYDETFFGKQLQQEITKFLSPWAYGNATEIKFGGRISKSVLINFIEDRPYVDYLTDFKLYHKIGTTQNDKEEIIASKAISILVSVPAEQHIIIPIPYLQTNAVAENCGCA